MMIKNLLPRKRLPLRPGHWLLGLLLGSSVLPVAAQRAAPVPAPPANVGDIAFNPATDRSSFQRCGEGQYEVPQYYQTNTTYAGGTKALRQLFVSKARLRSTGAQNGYITIRFLVNCRGETDRFRVTQLDTAYQPAQFGPALVAALLAQTKGLRAWQPGKFTGPGSHQGEALDCYYYLLFIIRDGRVADVLP